MDMVEAPITGGLSALKTGTMVTYLGGDKTVVDLVSPILSVGASCRHILNVTDITETVMVFHNRRLIVR